MVNTPSAPTSLPEDLLLLCADPDTGAARRIRNLDRGLGGAVLTELMLRGAFTVDEFRILDVRSVAPVDSFADWVLGELLSAKPRSWSMGLERWVRKASFEVGREYRELMASRGLLRVRTERALGIFPVTDWTVAEPDRISELRRRVDALARPEAHPAPSGQPDPRDVHLTALAAAMRFSRELYPDWENRDVRRRMKEYLPAAPIAEAVRMVVRADGSRRGGYSGGGSGM
ncbi:GPP34 family phosphoprotein [Streptomyces sp. NPDC047108]|uniref:GOLPH3/VPS74 family protein n=1 Tax=Streptomyces sp. NPDC047108 TaxID=3155025 RepID=UPI0033FDE7BF